MNRSLGTVIIAPMTSGKKSWPFRVSSSFKGKIGDIALEQIRAADRTRLIRKLGRLDDATASLVADKLVEIFERSP
jgi:mRNA interferase MazF